MAAASRGRHASVLLEQPSDGAVLLVLLRLARHPAVQKVKENLVRVRGNTGGVFEGLESVARVDLVDEARKEGRALVAESANVNHWARDYLPQ